MLIFYVHTHTHTRMHCKGKESHFACILVSASCSAESGDPQTHSCALSSAISFSLSMVGCPLTSHKTNFTLPSLCQLHQALIQ